MPFGCTGQHGLDPKCWELGESEVTSYGSSQLKYHLKAILSLFVFLWLMCNLVRFCTGKPSSALGFWLYPHLPYNFVLAAPVRPGPCGSGHNRWKCCSGSHNARPFHHIVLEAHLCFQQGMQIVWKIMFHWTSREILTFLRASWVASCSSSKNFEEKRRNQKRFASV